MRVGQYIHIRLYGRMERVRILAVRRAGTVNMPEQITRNMEPIRSCSQGSWLQLLGGKSERTKELRSMTPLGFSTAFFEANP